MTSRRWIKTILLLLVIFMLTSCAPEAATPVEPTTPPEAVAPVEPTTPAEPITLQVWYVTQSPEEIQLMELISDRFEEGHPGVTVEFSAYGWDEMNTNLKLALDSGTGPDVVYSSPGGNGHVTYAKAGHLVELTDYYHDRGWDKRFNEDFVMAWQKDLGGPIYGIPHEANVYGIFYNADLFNELGLQPPKTWGELETLLATLKEKGITPFATAGLDGWAYAHYWQVLAHAAVPIEKIESVMYNKPDVSYVADPGFLQATQVLKDWTEKGYFPEGFLGLNYADENALFLSRQTAMVLTGSWINASYLAGADFEVRLFAMPMMNTDLPWHTLINPNNVWILPKYSQHPDQALQYLDYMLSEEVAKTRWEAGQLSAYKFDVMPAATSTLQEDCGWVIQNVGGGYSFNANLPGSESYVFNILQKMGTDDLSPAEVVAGMEQNRIELLAEFK